MSQSHIPVSTYRFQFHSKFRLEKAKVLVDYLSALGIGDVYSSPLLAARDGSTHCYDTVDHSKLNPQITTDQDFVDFSDAIQKKGMGFLLDIVPNHIGINSNQGFTNQWWLDVMENGQASLFSHYFDIDWNRTNNPGKVLVPFFGKPIGQLLDDSELQVVYEKESGRFQIQYYSLGVPLDVASYAAIFEHALKHHSDQKIHDALEAARKIPAHTETNSKQERADQGKQLKEQIRKLMADDSTRSAIEAGLKQLNGSKEDPKSHDDLYNLIQQQAYRICHWKVAADEINYRRFFEINDLMAVRVEKKDVFEDAHRLVFQHVKDGRINALRIDHPDGLHDPARYFECLQKDIKQLLPQLGPDSKFYLLVEKILEPGEKLEKKWPIDGTTGYEFMNQLNSVFVDTENRQAFEKRYREVVPDGPTNFEDLLYQCKKLILNSSMESELTTVTAHLTAIAKRHRSSFDFTSKQIKRMLEELIACFPVYRTYITQVEGPSDNDRMFIKKAIDEVRHRNPSFDGQLVDYVDALLNCREDGLSNEEVESRRVLIMRIQQVTGPVMAKGLEDTAFYRYFMLASLNEVGGQPDRFGITREDFHKENVHRATNWPHSMSSSSTHDTKRSEDVRARLNVLSEIPSKFFDAVKQWQSLTAQHKTEVAGLGQVPHPNEEYLVYQTLIGGWPLALNNGKTASCDEDWKNRMTAYLTKCIKEAKLYTSWTQPNEAYEKAITGFAEKVMNDAAFQKAFLPFQKEISEYGKMNSLSQTVLKLTSPGVPDIYQGTEMYDYSLVDPDNRRTVDYEQRKKALDNIQSKASGDQSALIKELRAAEDDGSLKLFTLHKLLKFRQSKTSVVQKGDYVALEVSGDRKKNVVAFSRTANGQQMIVIVGRFFTELGQSTELPVGDAWKNTSVAASGEAKSFRDIFTGKTYNQGTLALKDLFTDLPYVVLESM